MILFIAFDPSETGAGFAAAMGADFDVLMLPRRVCSSDRRAKREMELSLAEIPPADALAADIASRASGYTAIAAVSSMASKDVLARVAGLLDAPMVTDAVAVVGTNRFKRPIFAGSIIATVDAIGLAGRSHVSACQLPCLGIAPGRSRERFLPGLGIYQSAFR